VTDSGADDKTAEMAPDRAAVRSPAEDAMHLRIVDQLRRIDACYGDDAPPGLLQLRGLVARADVTALRAGLDEVWNGVLGFHLEHGLQPHHQVTHAFRVLHGLTLTAR
jgi:hypothetical protein